MRLTRVFVEETLSADSRREIRGTAANHLARVLRLRVGDGLTLFDGRGGEYDARIEGFGRDSVLVAVGAHRADERESALALTLLQGVSRGERMDLVVQKATELGVRRIAPILAERSVVKLDAAQSERRLAHWRGIAIAACEQCGRNRLPEILPPRELHASLGGLPASGLRLLLSPGGDLHPAALRDVATDASEVGLLIGPEGGLTETEERLALRAGFRAMRLGPRILRTETAALAALAALQVTLGDLR